MLAMLAVRSALRVRAGVRAAQAVPFPALSPTMEDGSITQWLVAEGDAVAAGDPMFEVQTDKATLSADSPEDGVVARILVPAGDTVIKVGAPVVVLADDDEDLAAIDYSQFAAAPAAPEPAATAAAPAAAPAAPAAGPKPRLTPAVSRLVSMYGLGDQVGAIAPQGPHGMLLKGDVLAFIGDRGLKVVPAAKAPAPAAPAAPAAAAGGAPAAAGTAKEGPVRRFLRRGSEEIAATGMRKVIARRLSESKATVPHAYASIDVGMDAVLALRKKLAKEGTKTSVNDFVLRALALALRDVPEANAAYDEGADAVMLAPSVDISMAVAIEGGLVTPVIRGAESKTLLKMSAEARELAEKARTGKLLPEEYQGGSFSVSNLGMFGIDNFCAVINPPQGGNLAVGGSQKKLRMGPDGARFETTTTLTLSYDVRAIDDSVASRFLATLQERLGDPKRMLL